MTIDFSQFGAFAIVFVLMGGAVGYFVKQIAEERKRTDDQINLRISDQKEAKESSDKISNEVLILTRLIYELLTNKNTGVK